MKLISLLLCATFLSLSAESIRLSSPDESVQIRIETGGTVDLTVLYNDRVVIEQMKTGVDLLSEFKDYELKEIDRMIEPVAPTKFAQIHDHCVQATLNFETSQLQVRAYNNGAAYRWITKSENETNIRRERLQWPVKPDAQVYFPSETSMLSHNERIYKVQPFSGIVPDSFCSLPVLLQIDDVNVLFTEADVYDYPCMFLEKSGEGTLQSLFPPVVLETRPADDAPDRNQVIVREADYIAKVKPRQKLPWRVFMLADQDKELLTNDLVFQLSRPLQIENPDWIKPGTVAWDWWNALNIYGVDFESGINTETYKYYIDFASEYGLDYIILDEGWSQSTTNIKESNPDIDIHELVRYGEEKNVGVILWMLWGPLNRDMQEILERYADWGVKGIKVDFMQRSDQDMVLFYERCARIAAENQLLVNYHGAFKPTGLRRAYPNVVNFEGVKGLENCKWTDVITPEHDVTLPFIRMAVGPMDYTPGAMDNAHPVNFSARFTRPMSQGTRCHQAAMYVVYEAPLQMLSDSPSNYYREPETTEFISSIPTVWDSTVVLAAKVADYIAVARRHNDVWYVGAMTDGSPRTIILNLSFLSTGTYQADIMQDGTNAAKNAIDYERVKKQVTAETRLEIHMAPGGGWAGKFKAFRN